MSPESYCRDRYGGASCDRADWAASGVSPRRGCSAVPPASAPDGLRQQSFQVNTEPVQNVRRNTFAVRQQCEEQLVGLHLAVPRRSEARRRRRERPRHTRIEARRYNERQPGRAAEGILDDLLARAA
jgi:hypothetical protein